MLNIDSYRSVIFLKEARTFTLPKLPITAGLAKNWGDGTLQQLLYG